MGLGFPAKDFSEILETYSVVSRGFLLKEFTGLYKNQEFLSKREKFLKFLRILKSS